MSRVYVAGLGAVSPAGWGVPDLCETLAKGQPLPVCPLERPGWEKPLLSRPVPPPAERPSFFAHPRLRRASALTHYTVAAALEALSRVRSTQDGCCRLGLIVCLQAGCVKFSRRFFEETLSDPATASPLVFPETVYAAPGSHVAALLGNISLTHTLVGDAGCFLQGVALAAQCLEEEQVDAALVIGAEETDWILADALCHLERAAVLAGGAGALCLSCNSELCIGAELATITDAHTYSMGTGRTKAAQALRGQLGPGTASELLCDGVGNSPSADAAERAAWRNWVGARLSPKKILGEGLMAGAAWQCVAACEAVASGRFAAATVSLVGSNQQAIGARFVRAEAA